MRDPLNKQKLSEAVFALIYLRTKIILLLITIIKMKQQESYYFYSHQIISNYIILNQGEAGVAQKPYKDRYTFKKI